MKNKFDLPQSIAGWEKGDKNNPKKRYDVNDFSPVAAGDFTEIQGLDQLPPSFLEHFPDLADQENGFVIKRYLPEKISRLFKDFDCEYFLGKTKCSDSLSNQASILEKRQQMLLDYLGSDADLIVSSNFLVDKDYQHNFSLYEIQPRVFGGIGFADIFQLVEEFSEVARQRLREESERLLRVINKMIDNPKNDYLSKYLPDWHIGNLFILKDGRIKIFDNNLFDERSSGHQLSIFNLKRYLELLLSSLDDLETKNRHMNNL